MCSSFILSQFIKDVRNETPDYVEVDLPTFEDNQNKIHRAQWGQYTGNKLVDVVNNTYIEVVKWKRNLFKVPTGKVGEEFIEEVSKVMKLFNDGSDFEPLALTMLMIMFPLLLQKPSKSYLII